MVVLDGHEVVLVVFTAVRDGYVAGRLLAVPSAEGRVADLAVVVADRCVSMVVLDGTLDGRSVDSVVHSVNIAGRSVDFAVLLVVRARSPSTRPRGPRHRVPLLEGSPVRRVRFAPNRETVAIHLVPFSTRQRT